MSGRSRQPGMPWRFWLLTLCCGVMAEGLAHALEAPQNGGAAPVQTISVERDCLACASSGRLTLHRNGTAQWTQLGKARLGTADRSAQARLAPEDFARLVSLLEEAGFFTLNDSYDDPDTRDGPWVQFQVQRGTDLKQVFCRAGLEPPGLQRLDAALQALQARLTFNPEP